MLKADMKENQFVDGLISMTELLTRDRCGLVEQRAASIFVNASVL
jgi:hypothetical protein